MFRYQLNNKEKYLDFFSAQVDVFIYVFLQTVTNTANNFILCKIQ